MNKAQIQAIGNFLFTYSIDLKYIKMFQDFKENRISKTDYIKKETGSFYSFLIEFRVIRNITQGSADKLLKEAFNWIKTSNSDNVDQFAYALARTNLTRGNLATSLASKILFLNNPWQILPKDRLTRNAFKQKENNYALFKSNLESFRQSNQTLIEECLFYVNPMTLIIEDEFVSEIKELKTIRENRMIDKLLWSSRS